MQVKCLALSVPRAVSAQHSVSRMQSVLCCVSSHHDLFLLTAHVVPAQRGEVVEL